MFRFIELRYERIILGYEGCTRIELTICIQKAPQEKKKKSTAFPICKEIENNYMVAGSFFVFIIIEEGCRAE